MSAIRNASKVTIHRRPRLTPREQEVLHLISDGYENREIADALFLSVSTVRTHVEHILRKLKARNRAHAASIGFRLGLLAK